MPRWRAECEPRIGEPPVDNTPQPFQSTPEISYHFTSERPAELHNAYKIRIFLENYYLPGDLENQISDFVDHFGYSYSKSPLARKYCYKIAGYFLA